MRPPEEADAIGARPGRARCCFSPGPDGSPQRVASNGKMGIPAARLVCQARVPAPEGGTSRDRFMAPTSGREDEDAGACRAGNGAVNRAGSAAGAEKANRGAIWV